MRKLAIFDLDGTLFDTLADICDALDYVFTKNSLIPPTLEEAETLMGDGLKAFLDKACLLRGVAACPDYVMQEFITHYGDNCCNRTSLYDDVLPLLEKLQMNDVKLAVLSNKSEALVKQILEEFKLTNKFIAISGGDTFIEKKPSPLPIIETLKILGFTPNEAIMIGDSENDVAAGSKAGVITCYCGYGYGRTLQTTPDYTVGSASEIFEIVMRR